METKVLLNILNKRFGDLERVDFLELLENHKLFGISETKMKLIKRKEKKQSFAEIFNEKDIIDSEISILERLDETKLADFGYKEEFILNLNKMTPLQICFFIDRLGLCSGKTGARFFGNKHQTNDAYYLINRSISTNLGTQYVFKVFGPRIILAFKWVHVSLINVKEIAKCLESTCTHHFYLLKVISETVLNIIPTTIKAESQKEFFDIFTAEAKRLTNALNRNQDYIEFGDIIEHSMDNIKKSAGKNTRNTDFAIRVQVEDLYESPLDYD